MAERLKVDVPNKGKPEWVQTLLQFQRPDRRKALWQLFDTFSLYALLWCLMILNLRLVQSVWIHLGLLVVAAGVYVRIFIFFHDCCHQSFFTSRQVNTMVGHICGVLTVTPYESWRRSHGIHHNTVSDLDRRGHGAIPGRNDANHARQPAVAWSQALG